MIKLQNVCKSYQQNGQSTPAIKNISFQVKPGEIFGIIGKSGAGKSTLMRCINLLETLDSGCIYINDIDFNTLRGENLRKARQQLGMVFQHFNLLSTKTVLENVALPLVLQHMPKREIQTRCEKLLDLVDLLSLKNKYPDALSGGQKQRVAIARALVTEPKVLLCDEATSALDPESTGNILQLLKKINQELGQTILLITHEMDVVKKICNSVGVLEAGELVESGSVIDVFAKPQSNITKTLVHNMYRHHLPEELQTRLQQEKTDEHYPLVRFCFVGRQVQEPLIATLYEKFAVRVSILQADLDWVQGIPFGYCLCKVGGDKQDIEKAINYLESLDITGEVVGYV